MTCQPAVLSSLQHTDVLDIRALTQFFILYLIAIIIFGRLETVSQIQKFKEVQHVDKNPEPPTHCT